MGFFSNKPAAVNHDLPSAGFTTLWSAAKGAILGALAITIGATLLGAAGGAIVGSILAINGGLAGYGAIAGLIGGAIFSATTALPVTGGLAAIGGLFGLAQGGTRVSREKAEFNRQIEEHSQTRQHVLARQQNNAYIKGMQDNYPVAYNDGRASMMRDLQAAAMQEMQQQKPTAAAAATATANASAKCACGPHSEAVIKREQAAAAAKAGVVQPG